MNYTVFFPIVRQPKTQLAGDGGSRFTAKPTTTATAKPTMQQPLYETEAAVTTAIALGTFKGNSTDAYRLAREWQKYLKSLETKHFHAKAATANRNGKYIHVMFGAH